MAPLTSVLPRRPNPVWDLDLDLNTPPPDEQYSPPPPQLENIESANPSRKRPPSPVWDIELDLNPSDVEEAETTRKRHKSEHPENDEDDDGFGSTDLLK